MNTDFLIENNVVHLWSIFLPSFFDEERSLRALLAVDEIERADRFHFREHAIRFLTARGMLRKILSLYLKLAPQDISFSYAKRGKPFLTNNPLDLQFNISHSHDYAVYALTKKYEIGVDIEKIENKNQEGIAERFFSPEEFSELKKIPESERPRYFYAIWAKKEAMIKALGEGLYAPLDEFSVSLNKRIETVNLKHNDKFEMYHVESFFVVDDYQSAFATNQNVSANVFWQWKKEGIIKV